MTIGPGDTQAAVDARKAAWAVRKSAMESDSTAKQSRKDAVKAHNDNKPVTWGDLRGILIDAGIIDP